MSVMFEPRSHQLQMTSHGEHIASLLSKFNMLCHVVCGGGKSYLPALLMRELPEQYKFAWIVPRAALQNQAALDAAADEYGFGVSLRDSGNDVDPRRGSRGVVTCHQSFYGAPDLWLSEFSRCPYVLFVDEAHHAKVDNRGRLNALASAIERVTPRLFGLVYLTGTLSTGDGKKIYGINYSKNDNGKLQPTVDGWDHVIRYRRAVALDEHAIIPIEFFHHDGPVKWEYMLNGDTTEMRLSEADKDNEGKAVHTAIKTELAESLFVKGYEHWKKFGNKLLVVCCEQSDARKWHTELLNRGERSFLAISDNSDAVDHINVFKKSDRACLVTCAMAYEGLDEKKLTHVVCLTHIRSTPWIEQMLARVWRSSKEFNKPRCFAFVPDDPRMNRVIKKIKSEQPESPSEMREGGGGGGGGGDLGIIPLESLHHTTRMSGLDHNPSCASLSENQQAVLDAVVAAGLNPDDDAVIEVLRRIEQQKKGMNGRVLTEKERESLISKEIDSLCKRFDWLHGMRWGKTATEVMRWNKWKPLEELNLDQLRRTLQYVKKNYA